MNYSLVSIVIPTYNEEKNIARCLDSICTQDYPAEKMQVMVIDDNSIDRTQEIVKKYPVKLIIKDYKDIQRGAEPSKVLGFTKAKGEFFIYLEADSYLSDKTFLSRLVKPLIENEKVAGSFSRSFPDYRLDAPINRYLSYHELHYDPLVEHFACSLKETFIQKGQGYTLCRFKPERMPPVGCCLYRMKDLKEIIKDPKTFAWIDTEIPYLLAERGKDLFAYIADVGYYHHSIRKFGDLIKQKRRDVTKTFLPGLGTRKITYIDLTSTESMFKLLLWLIYANLVIPSLIRAFYKMLKYRDWACIYEVPVTIVITDYILYLFLKEEKGRKIIKDFLKAKLLPLRA